VLNSSSVEDVDGVDGANCQEICKKSNLGGGMREVLEMGKNPHCLGSVLFGFYDY